MSAKSSVAKPDSSEARLETLCKKYRIEFAGEIPSADWPDRHRKTLANARQVSEYTYEAYATEPHVTENNPWKIEVKQQAITLTEVVKRCQYRNESSWRHACEPIILGRLSAEVCCRKCRKRRWRSEIEVTREETSSAATRLSSRQKARQPCRCPRSFRPQDQLEATGINQIFTFRIDEEVHHEAEVARDLKKGEKPDRLYGLRETRNIENLLHDAAQRKFQGNDYDIDRQVHEILGLDQPVIQTGDRLLFPFIVLEAKSGRSKSEWESIRKQTAFSIRTLLQTQERLHNATGEYSKWQAGPLVWFFSNRGEDWRVSAAYTESVPPTNHTIGNILYRIADIWQGSIATRNGALQLMLLIDYVFDWGRDVYREDIMNELRVLASGDNDLASTLPTDPDIMSTRQVECGTSAMDDSLDKSNDYAAYQSALQAYDLNSCAIRHAGIVESKYGCILLNGDTFKALLHSTEANDLQNICRRIMDYFKPNAILLSGQDLDAIEEMWTGTKRFPAIPYHTNMAYYTAITYTTFITSEWGIVRELYMVAIAKNTWAMVVKASKLKSKSRALEPIVSAEIPMFGDILRTITRLRAGSSLQVLMSAMKRRAVLIQVKDSNGQIIITEYNTVLRKVVNGTYLFFKRGHREPQEPFCRFSQRLELQSTFCNDDPIFDEMPLASEEGCVLVSEQCNYTFRTKYPTSFCAYITTGITSFPDRDMVASTVKKAFESQDFHITAKTDSIRYRYPLSQLGVPECGWNQDIETRIMLNSSFGRFIKHLTGQSPVTQGCPRNQNASGRHLLSRQLKLTYAQPFDRFFRRSSCYNYSTAFFIYKLLSREFSHWRTTATDRRARGIPCCMSCAAVGEAVESCAACIEFLEDPNRFTWMKRGLRGLEAIEVKESSKLATFQRLVKLTKQNWHDIQDLRKPIQREKQTDHQWEEALDFYDRLNEPFADIEELEAQLAQLQKYCEEIIIDKEIRILAGVLDLGGRTWMIRTN